MNTEFSTATTSMLVETQPTGPEPWRIDLKRLVRLRWWVILLVAAAVALPAILLVWRSVPLEYTATAELRFLASTPRVLDHDINWDALVPYEKFLNTQIGLITGSATLKQVAADPEVANLKLLANNTDRLGFLKAVIKATIEQDSELVKVTCTLPDREAATLLLDKTIGAYMAYALGEEANTGGERLRVLYAERDTRQGELDAQLKRINELQQNLGMPLESVSELGAGEVRPYREVLARAEEDLLQAGSRVALHERELARIQELQQTVRAGRPVFEFGIEDLVTADARVAAMRQDAAKAEVAYKTLVDRYADGSLHLDAARANHDAAKDRVAGTEREVRAEVLNSTRARIQQELDVARKLEQDARARKEKFDALITSTEQRAMNASRTIAELDELKLRAEETRALLRAVRDEITSIGMESNAPARVKLASPVTAPLTPHGGRRLQMAALALALAMVAGAGAGFLLEMTDQQVRSPQDLAHVTAHPVLAAIPHSGAEAFPREQPLATIAADRPDTATANEFRKLVARLAYTDVDLVEVNSCLVTSPTLGDGKTVVACNLALALAEANRRVLIIDTAPGHAVETVFDLDPRRGLAEVLLGGYSLRDVVRPTLFGGLFVLGGGLQPANLSTKLASREMVELLEECERHFDHVIIDTPPALLLSDAKCLAAVVDGVVVVAGAGRSTRGMVQRTINELTQTGGTLLGVVANRIRPSLGGYLRSHMRLFRAYSSANKNGKNGPQDLPEMEVLDVETVDAP